MRNETTRLPVRPRAGRAVTASTVDRVRTRRAPRAAWSILWVVPALVVYALFTLWPVMHSFGLSFFDWNGLSDPEFTGFENYVEVMSDDTLRDSLWHAAVLVVFFSFLPVAIGLVTVALLTGARLRGMAFYRSVLFLPQIVPLVAVGITWRWMYSDQGAVNELLRVIGLDALTRTWLGEPEFGLIAVGLIGTWIMTGLCMMLFLAGVGHIDTALYEAVKLDGAGPIRAFFSITIPQLRNEITVALTITIVAALASFDIVYVTTNGGPVDRTNVPGLLIYRLAFSRGEIGLASALAVLLGALILVAVFLLNRLLRTDDE